MNGGTGNQKCPKPPGPTVLDLLTTRTAPAAFVSPAHTRLSIASRQPPDQDDADSGSPPNF